MTLIDKAEALLPCPFCGEVPEIKERGESIALFVCSAAPCKGSSMFMGFVREDREKAIASWNRRALPARGVRVKDFDVEIVRGNTGGNLSLYFNDHRVAGSKPWGGGTTIHSFRVQGDEVKSSGIFATIRNVQTVPADKDFLTTAALAPTDAAQDDDPECTDCGGTGITYQTERRCACQPTDAAQAREAALKKAAQLAYEVWDDPEALAKAILALIGEGRE